MRCPQCAAQVDDPGARFCEVCGAELPAAAADVEQAPPAADVGQPPPAADVGQPPAVADVGQPSSAAEDQPDRREQLRPYLEALMAAWADGRVDVADVRRLADLRQEYGVTPEEATALEREVTRSVAEGEPVSFEAPPPEDVASGELRLDINDNRFLMEGHSGLIHLRLTNIADRPLQGLKLTLRSSLLPAPFTHTFRLQPGRRIERRVQILPDVGGEHLLNIDVCYLVDDEPKAFTAQAGLMVLDRFQTPAKLLIDMRGMVQVTAEKIYGQSIRADVERMVQQGVIKTANDLMQAKFPDHFQPIGLEFDYEATEALRDAEKARRAKRIAPGFGERPAQLTRASLCWELAGRRHNVLLLAMPVVSFGRSRDRNAVALRVWPRSDLNDDASLQISQQHFEIALREDGLAVIDDAPPSTNGTFLNGRRIETEQVIDPSGYRTSRLVVGNAVLKLRLDFFPCKPDAEAVNPYERLMGDGEPPVWALAGRAGLRALRLARLNNLGPRDPNGEERYLLVYRWVQVGASVGNAIVIPGAGLDEIHARLLHFDGGFWLEPLSRSEPTTVNDHPLQPDTLIPLSPGMTLTLGTATIQFRDCNQLFL